MSDDMREDALARLLVIMQTVTGISTAVRNRSLLGTEKRPAMVLLDGDELPRLSIDTSRIKGRAMMMIPQIVSLRPEVYILLKEDRPNHQTLGQDLNAFRIDFFKKMWADAALTSILGSNGSIVYYGCETDLKSGSALSGQMRLDFILNYVLRPTA